MHVQSMSCLCIRPCYLTCWKLESFAIWLFPQWRLFMKVLFLYTNVKHWRLFNAFFMSSPLVEVSRDEGHLFHALCCSTFQYFHWFSCTLILIPCLSLWFTSDIHLWCLHKVPTIDEWSIPWVCWYHDINAFYNVHDSFYRLLWMWKWVFPCTCVSV